MERIIVTTPEELSALIDERFRIAFKHYAPQTKPRQPDDAPGEAVPPYVSKREAARLISVCQSSIDGYARKGLLKRRYAGKKVLFERSEVLALIKTNTNHKQNR